MLGRREAGPRTVARTWLNQKQDCPLLHSLVPLLQEQVYGSMVPVFGNFPWDHAGRSASTELRDGGMIMEPWPQTVATSEEKSRARIIEGHRTQAVRPPVHSSRLFPSASIARTSHFAPRPQR